jgi:hypothetical protein
VVGEPGVVQAVMHGIRLVPIVAPGIEVRVDSLRVYVCLPIIVK